MALMENEVSPRVPKEQSQSDTLMFVTTEGEQIVFECMDAPIEEAALLMAGESMDRTRDNVDAHADTLRDGLLASGVTLEDMLTDLRRRRETDSNG